MQMENEIKKTETVSISKVDNATLKVLAKKVIAKKEKKEIRKTKTKEKNFIYKFQLADKKLSAKDEKKMRNKLRRKMQNIVNEIIISKDKKAGIKNFLLQYKKEYILNDFTLESISNSSDETKREDLEKVLSIVKAKR
ncbi:MAG: hypothetical protein WD876_03730 [Candidatus Pacearchaeota archaeon]